MCHVFDQLSILRALVIRDLMARFGRRRLGFVWTVLEPMILCSGVMLIWSFIHDSTMHGVPLITMVLTGYMPLTLWRHLTNPMALILRANSNLLYHQPVSHIHVILARSLLEFFSTTGSLSVIFFVLTTAGLVEPVRDPGLALAAWLYIGWYFGAMGLIMGALTEYWELAEKFIQPFNYLMLPLSGVYFMVDWMPGYAQKLLLLNPSVHSFEMFRSGFLGEGFVTHYDVGYLTASSTVMTSIAAAAIYHVRDRIQVG